MREVIDDIHRWRKEGQPIALATVVDTWGSAPRRPGAKLAVAPGARMAGSVSGGCVEGAVVEAAGDVLNGGSPRLLSFGVADETAWSVGLACGGEVRIFVEGLDEGVEQRIAGWLAAETGGCAVTAVAGPEAWLGRKVLVGADGTTEGGIAPAVDAVARTAAKEALAARKCRSTSYENEESGVVELFCDVVLPRTTLVMVGGVHISIALAHLARTLDFRTVVVEPRQAFGSPERFPHVDRLVTAWPREAFAEVALSPSSAVAVLTHDPKIDDPALEAALESPAFYIGALGSQKTQAKRRARFEDKGIQPEQIARIHGPIGLEIGARTPEEIALAILAQTVAAYHGAPAAVLR